MGSDFVISVDLMHISWWWQIFCHRRQLPFRMSFFITFNQGTAVSFLALTILRTVTILKFIVEHVHEAFRKKIIEVVARLFVELLMTFLALLFNDWIYISNSYSRISFGLNFSILTFLRFLNCFIHV